MVHNEANGATIVPASMRYQDRSLFQDELQVRDELQVQAVEVQVHQVCIDCGSTGEIK